MQVNTLNIPFNLTQITKVPMIYIRLPPKIINSVPTNLQTVQNSLNTIQTVMSNGKLESRSLTVANTEHLLIISIPRRTYKPIGTGIYNLPQVFNFSSMPHHAIGLEVLNDTPVATNKCLIIPNLASTADNKRFSDKLFLKSAVVLKERKDNQHHKFIYGTKTYMINYHSKDKEIRVYNPISDIQKIDTTTNQISMIPLRYLTHIYHNKIVRNAVDNLPEDSDSKEKYVTSLEEEDKIHDFLQRQTILIYTNELKHNCDIKDFNAGTNDLPELSSTSSQTDCIQYHYNNIVKSLDIDTNINNRLYDLKMLCIISLVILFIDDTSNSTDDIIPDELKQIVENILRKLSEHLDDYSDDAERENERINFKKNIFTNNFALINSFFDEDEEDNNISINKINKIDIDIDNIFKKMGAPLKEGNDGNKQLNVINQFTISKYVGDFPFINNNITYKIEDQTNQEKVAAGTSAKNAIGILKTDIGLVSDHF